LKILVDDCATIIWHHTKKWK